MSPSPSPTPIGGETLINPNPHGGQKTALGKVYIPRIYGFKVSERARNGPRMKWLRERPERWEELDTVDWKGRFKDGLDPDEDMAEEGADDEEVKGEEDQEAAKEGETKGKGKKQTGKRTLPQQQAKKGKLFDDEEEEEEEDDDDEEEEEDVVAPTTGQSVKATTVVR